MSSSLEAPPAAASLVTHPTGRECWRIGALVWFALSVMPICFAAPTGICGAILLIGLAAAAHEACSRGHTVLAALARYPLLASRLEPVKLK